MLEALQSKIYGSGLWHRVFKTNAEADHWVEAIDRIVAWYNGEEHYHFPPPAEELKEKRFDEKKNALLTWIRVELQHATYLQDLQLRADSFVGMRVADIGSGPMPTLLVFKDCERHCIDHLLAAYKWHGFPLDEFNDSIHWIDAKTEALPTPDGFFDVIISRDALDHVDDFAQTAREIHRALKPGGWLHFSINYHHATSSEPQELDDHRVLAAFSGHNLRKLKELPGAWGFKTGKTVIWTNVPEDRLAPI
ncbi:MAG TPA: methyltransferase domain-containing protein [Methylomirabilota bacterium]|nr:methyltransferase domain-containing protein [Methylomirabilota bacterium]